MEWQLPLQKVEIGNINIGSPWGHHVGERNGSRAISKKPMAPLSYFGTQFRLPCVSLIFPPLPVVEYNSTTGKLIFDMFEMNLASIKLNTLQDTIVNAICYHQAGWFRTEFTKEEISKGFHPIIQNNHLQLYCPSASASASASTTEAGVTEDNVRSIPLFKDGEWYNSFSPSDLKTGTRIRVAVKINGISFLTSDTGAWNGRCRLQHRIIGMIVTGTS